jgi:hypothetical protein
VWQKWIAAALAIVAVMETLERERRSGQDGLPTGSGSVEILRDAGCGCDQL